MSSIVRSERADEILLEPSEAISDEPGSIRYVNGFFSLKDSTGLYDPRFPEMNHDELDTLIHQIAESGYEEYIYTGPRLTNWIFWTNISKLIKIREEIYTYSGNLISSFVNIQYNNIGTEIYRVTVNNFNYLGNKLQNAVWTKS